MNGVGSSPSVRYFASRYYANDFDGPPAETQDELLADRELSGPRLPGERFVDDRDGWRARAIGRGEVAAGDKGKSQGPEVAWRDNVLTRVDCAIVAELIRSPGATAFPLPRERHDAGRGGCVKPGQLLDPRDQFLGKRSSLVGVVSAEAKIEADDLDAVDREAWIDRTGISQRPPQQQRTHHQDNGERHLRDHKGRTRPPTPPIIAAVTNDQRCEIDARGRASRCETAAHTNEHREHHREGDDPPVDGQVEAHVEPRQRQQLLKNTNGPPRSDQTNHRARSRHHHALDHEQPHDAVAGSAQRKSKAEFGCTCHPANEQHSGDVEGGNEEDESHEREQQRDEPVHDRTEAHRHRTRRRDADAMTTIAVGMLAFEIAADSRHFSPGLIDRDAIFQSSNAHQPLPPAQPHASKVVTVRVRRDRNPEALVVEGIPIEALSGDTDDGERTAVQVDRASDDTRVAAKLRLPQTIADDSDGARAREALVFRQEAASERDRNTKHSEVVGRHVRARDAGGALRRPQSERRNRPGMVGRETRRIRSVVLGSPGNSDRRTYRSRSRCKTRDLHRPRSDRPRRACARRRRRAGFGRDTHQRC